MRSKLILFCMFALSTALVAQTRIPAGTVIPVTLNTSLSSSNSRQGQVVTANVAQKVPLYNGQQIKAGTRVVGEVIAVTPAQNSQPASITLRFNQIDGGGQSTPILTHLRAIASPQEIEAAQVSYSGDDRGSEPLWSQTTVQIGGDVVYRGGGPVSHGIETVGTPVDDGVLSRVSANPEGECRGAIDGNNNPQALWVFSSDACGVYGYDIAITDAGRTSPAGNIVLQSPNGGDLKLRNHTGLLLRVVGSPNNTQQNGN